MLDLGIIRPSKGSFSIDPFTKGSGTGNACGGYRSLNAVIKSDPSYTRYNSHCARENIFTKLDPIKAYYQIPVESEHIPKTTIAISFGLFEFLRVPFGLRNAALSFQRLIDHVLHSLHFT